MLVLCVRGAWVYAAVKMLRREDAKREEIRINTKASGGTVFLVTFGLFLFANGISYFLLSDGYGVKHVNDGIIRVGWPFVMFERGGFSYREEFYLKAAALDLICGIVIGAVIAVVFVFRAYDER